jgi:type IV conjugative transfer system protein TraE
MLAGKYLERLDQAVWLSRILQLGMLLLTLAILIMARQRTIVHIVPPVVSQEYRVGPTSASKEYLSQMASFLTTTALTVNADNAEFAARAFLRYLTPEARGRLDTTLLAEAAYIKKTGLTQAFYPRAIDFYSPQRLRVTGTLVQWLGGKVVTQRDVSYTMTLEVRNYAVTILDFAPAQGGQGPEAGPPADRGPAPAGPAVAG